MIGIKIVISIAILCITSYIGIELSSSLNRREKILVDMVTFLRLVKNEMKYMLSSLPEVFEKSRQGLNSIIKYSIGSIVVDMEKYGVESVDKSIQTNIDSIEELSVYDKQVIISTLKNLGKGDIDTQSNIISNSIEILDRQVKEAKNKKESNTKVYRTVGVISGLLIIVIFI